MAWHQWCVLTYALQCHIATYYYNSIVNTCCKNEGHHNFVGIGMTSEAETPRFWIQYWTELACRDLKPHVHLGKSMKITISPLDSILLFLNDVNMVYNATRKTRSWTCCVHLSVPHLRKRPKCLSNTLDSCLTKDKKVVSTSLQEVSNQNQSKTMKNMYTGNYGNSFNVITYILQHVGGSGTFKCN